MIQEEIIDRIEVCPWRERRYGPYVCTRFINHDVPCDGAWVVDYSKLKEKKQKNKL